MGGRGRALLSLSFILQFSRLFSVTIVETLLQGVNLTFKDQLISSSKVFNLNFFSYPPTHTLYLGITFSAGCVWVANQNHPIDGSFARFIIDDYGNLKIFYDEVAFIVVYKSDAAQAINASATLQDNGNFVLRETYPDGSTKRILWKSFDYPSNILLPGMRLGINWGTGDKWSLTSWIGLNTPARGSFTLGMDPDDKNQLVIWWRGIVYWTSGPLKNGTFNNLRTESGQSDHNFTYSSTGGEAFFRYFTRITTSADIFYIGLNPEGQLYGKVFVSCSTGNSVLSSGCVHQKPPNCRNPQTYISLLDFQYGNMSETGYTIDKSEKLSLYDCGFRCMNTCSCVAYSSTTNDRTSCEMWTGDNKFVASSNGRPVYFIKDLPITNVGGGKSVGILSKLWIICIGGAVFVIFISFFVCYVSWRECRMEAELRWEENELFDEIKAIETQSIPREKIQCEVEKTSNGIHIFRFKSIAMTTNNFSLENKLGEGGFGSVYKGTLFDGQEIAIKRLSNSSKHGLMKIKNEVKLIAKLQHINVIRLHGLCIEKGEKMFIYEYMPNRSLNLHLFDSDKKVLLNWKTRFGIIHGIAQGLVYLHEYSRLKIIHLYLKPSNILLDYEMNPKIYNFKIARIFGSKGSKEHTDTVIGTLGYMPPEYILCNVVSTKTDVFSFGVLLLEIVSGKRNDSCYNSDYLIGYAWQLWNEGRAFQLIDPTLDETCAANEILRCIHIGLLCVQNLAGDRPTMLDVVSYLSSEAAQLAEPKQPAFFMDMAAKEPKSIVKANITFF